MPGQRFPASGGVRDTIAYHVRLDSSRSTEIGRALRRAFRDQTSDDRTDKELQKLLEQLC